MVIALPYPTNKCFPAQFCHSAQSSGSQRKEVLNKGTKRDRLKIAEWWWWGRGGEYAIWTQAGPDQNQLGHLEEGVCDVESLPLNLSSTIPGMGNSSHPPHCLAPFFVFLSNATLSCLCILQMLGAECW